jgi:hypothetical protein
MARALLHKNDPRLYHAAISPLSPTRPTQISGQGLVLYVPLFAFFVQYPIRHPLAHGRSCLAVLPTLNSVARPFPSLRDPPTSLVPSVLRPSLVMHASWFSSYNAPASSAFSFPHPLLDYGSSIDDLRPFIARASARPLTYLSILHTPCPRRPYTRYTPSSLLSTFMHLHSVHSAYY